MALKGLALVRAGERTSADGKAVINKILLAMPDAEYRFVRPHLEYLDFPRHHTLHEPNEKTQFVYFLNVGMLSLVVVALDGRTVEAGIVGKEGIVGLASAVGLTRNPHRHIVQIAGSGFKIAVEVVQDVLRSSPHLQMLLNRYSVLHALQVSQTAACNRLHHAEQRLSRWLLMTQDRIDSPLLGITQDFLATMLGTDRPSVTLAASRLKRKGLIQYSRGSVKIVNRRKLEKCACECYAVVQQFNGDLGLK